MITLSTNKKIDCPIFQAREDLVLADIISAANGALTDEDKIQKLEELLDELGSLLSCPAYGVNSKRCETCREICAMRRARIAANLASICQDKDRNDKIQPSFVNYFKNLPSEIARDLEDSKKFARTIRK